MLFSRPWPNAGWKEPENNRRQRDASQGAGHEAAAGRNREALLVTTPRVSKRWDSPHFGR